MEISTDSSSSSHNHPHLPPGFRFHPTDEELVVHYLKKKASSAPLPVTIIAEVDLYKFDPWELPGKATFGEQEWYFFSPRDRKYPNGARPNRAATSGYWKATGTDKPILTSGGTQKVGVKKALVFYGGKPPKGIKTNWIMHEYRLITDTNNGNSMKPPGVTTDLSGKKSSLRLDDWVLCRIYKKNNNTSQRPLDQSSSSREDSMEEMLVSSKPQITAMKAATNYSELIENDEDHFFEDLLSEGGGVNIQHTSNHDISKRVESGSSSMGPVSTTQSLKRSLPQQPYNYGAEAGVAPASKRFSGSSTTGGSAASAAIVMDQAGNNGTSNSISALLNQLPPQAVHQFHQQSVLVGSLNDGVFGRQPYQHLSGMNWNS